MNSRTVSDDFREGRAILKSKYGRSLRSMKFEVLPGGRAMHSPITLTPVVSIVFMSLRIIK